MIKSEWAAILETALHAGEETVPDGWLTYQQIAAEWNRSESHTRRIVKDMLAAGQLKSQAFRVMTRGGTKALPHFRSAVTAKQKHAAI